jgi:protein phosphatase
MEYKLYQKENMRSATAHDVADGTAIVFSRKSPAKETANEDSALILSCNKKTAMLAITDGMGGLPAGAQASAEALKQLHKRVAAACNEDGDLRHAILNGIDLANQSIISFSTGSATTLVVAEINGAIIRPYHIGDSVLLIVGQRGKIKLQTVAHSPVGYAIEAGVIDESEALFHHERHLVSNFLGTNEMRIEIGSPIELAPKDTLLLASDGLFDNLTLPEITEIIRKGPLADAANNLISNCEYRMLNQLDNLPSKPDDMSFILYRHGNKARF